MALSVVQFKSNDGVTISGAPWQTAINATQGWASSGAGSLIVLGILYDSARTLQTLNDNNSNNYLTQQAFTLTVDGALWKLEQYYLANAGAGITTITATFDSGGNTRCHLIGWEVGGAATSSTLDQVGGTTTVLAASPWTSADTPTTTQAAEILIGQAYSNFSNDVTFAVGGSWTNGIHIGNIGAGHDFFMESQIVSSTGAYHAQGTDTGGASTRWAALGTYKEAAAAAGTVLTGFGRRLQGFSYTQG